MSLIRRGIIATASLTMLAGIATVPANAAPVTAEEFAKEYVAAVNAADAATKDKATQSKIMIGVDSDQEGSMAMGMETTLNPNGSMIAKMDLGNQVFNFRCVTAKKCYITTDNGKTWMKANVKVTKADLTDTGSLMDSISTDNLNSNVSYDITGSTFTATDADNKIVFVFDGPSVMMTADLADQNGMGMATMERDAVAPVKVKAPAKKKIKGTYASPITLQVL